jgi:hypothetical protein
MHSALVYCPNNLYQNATAWPGSQHVARVCGGRYVSVDTPKDAQQNFL